MLGAFFCLLQAASLVSSEGADEAWRTRIDAQIDRVRKADAEIRNHIIDVE